MFGARAAAYSFHYFSCYDKKMFRRVQPPYLFCVPETDGLEKVSRARSESQLCVCVCVCQTAPYLHAATVLLRGSFTHQCVCAPSPRRYKWPRERLFNGGEQREGSTGRQTARLRDLTPARHANPSNTSYLLCPISWASKGGNAIRCSYIMKERPNRTERVLLCVAHVRAGL